MCRDDLLKLFKDNNILVKNDRLNPQRYKYLNKDINLYNIYNNYISEFRTEKEAIYCLKHNISHADIPLCPICGKLVKFVGKYYNKTCGYCNYNDWCEKKNLTKLHITDDKLKQAKKKREETCLKLYGKSTVNQFINEESRTKYEQDCLDKYGVKNPSQLQIVKDKRKRTCINKYGVDCNLMLRTSDDVKSVWNQKHNEILQKRAETSYLKYGTEFPMQSDIVKDKIKQSLINHHGTLEKAYHHINKKANETKIKLYNDINYNNIDKIKQTIDNKHSEFEISNNCTRYTKLVSQYGQGWLSLELPYIYNNRYRYIDNKYLKQIKQYSLENHSVQSVSKTEFEIYDYVKSIYNGKIIKNTRKIIKDDNHQYELDIYLPEIKLAIEFNGNFWHSTRFKDKYYHQIKSLLCFKQNVLLIHIYEFDYINNKDKCLNKLKYIIINRLKSKDNRIIFEQYEPKIINQIKSNNNIYDLYDDGIKILQYY